jgi:hypothetical protein
MLKYFRGFLIKKRFRSNSFEFECVLFFKLTQVKEQRKNLHGCMFCLRRWTQSALIVLSSFDHYKKGTICGFVYACECMCRTLVYIHSCMFLFSFSLLSCVFFSLFFFIRYTWKVKERRGDLIFEESTKWNERRKKIF